MAGHSKWANIKHRKSRQDAKRSQLFSRLVGQITSAAKQGADVASNPALRLAIDQARQAGMPKENIDRAISRGAGQGQDANLISALYEAYGAGGAALIIQVLTDNPQRALSGIRATLNRFGARLAQQGAALFQFEKQGEDWVAKMPLELPEEERQKNLQLIQTLEGLEDVQEVFTNF